VLVEEACDLLVEQLWVCGPIDVDGHVFPSGGIISVVSSR
jgi:hypothetical protein